MAWRASLRTNWASKRARNSASSGRGSLGACGTRGVVSMPHSMHQSLTDKVVLRVAELDRLLVHLALPSLGQWVAMLRGLARHFGARPDAAAHPLGHVWEQLNRPYRDRPGL